MKRRGHIPENAVRNLLVVGVSSLPQQYPGVFQITLEIGGELEQEEVQTGGAGGGRTWEISQRGDSGRAKGKGSQQLGREAWRESGK